MRSAQFAELSEAVSKYPRWADETGASGCACGEMGRQRDLNRSQGADSSWQALLRIW